MLFPLSVGKEDRGEIGCPEGEESSEGSDDLVNFYNVPI